MEKIDVIFFFFNGKGKHPAPPPPLSVHQLTSPAFRPRSVTFPPDVFSSYPTSASRGIQNCPDLFPGTNFPLFLETRHAQHADAERSLPSIRCVRVASTPVPYFPSKQNSLQESPVIAISSSTHPLLPLPHSYTRAKHVLCPPPHTSFWLPLYHTVLSF